MTDAIPELAVLVLAVLAVPVLAVPVLAVPVLTVALLTDEAGGAGPVGMIMMKAASHWPPVGVL